jgi:hypothetical protein
VQGPAEPTVALPTEPAPDAATLRRIRPGLYRWEDSVGEPRLHVRALAVGALAVLALILLVLVLQTF